MRSLDNGQGLCAETMEEAKRRGDRRGRRGAQRLNNGTSWKRGVMPAGVEREGVVCKRRRRKVA